METILFVDIIYGTPRGHSYVNKLMLETLKEAGYKVGICKSMQNPIFPEFTKPDFLIENTIPNNLEMSEEQFRSTLEEYKPSWCIFVEYGQWNNLTHDKVAICKELGIKTVGFNMWEKLDWNKKEHYKLYTKILCPTGFQTNLMRKHGLYNAVHIPWGMDFKELDDIVAPVKQEQDKDKVIFFHCAGSGGVGDRKNTNAVIEAYNKIKDKNTDLIITHLAKQVFSRKDIISFTKLADVILNPSKWDTIGLNTIEANICGKPVIVADTEPMNEIIQNRKNGLTVKGEKGVCKHVTCPSYEVDIEDLAKKMSYCKKKVILETLQSNARKFAETNFDWSKNKKHFLKMFEVKNE